MEREERRLHTREGSEAHRDYLEQYLLEMIGKVSLGEMEPEDLAREIAKRINALEQEMIRDPLTGAFSRAYFGATLSHEMAVERAHEHPLALVMFDLDNFKEINDYEPDHHLAGDRTLKTFVEILANALPENSLIGRLSGEEFAVLLLDFTQDELVEWINKAVLSVSQNLASQARLTRERVTTSVGACLIQPGDTYDEVMIKADRALYQAKEEGRNRAVIL